MEEFERWWGEFQNSQKLGHTEVRFRRADGEYRWFQISAAPVHDEQARLIRWYATATDIDDRKRAEEKLSQSEQDLRTITDTIRQPIVVPTPDGTMLYVNRVLLDLTGRTLDNVIEHPSYPWVFHPEDVERVRAERQDKLLCDTPFDLQMRLLGKDGQYRWHLFEYEPFKDDRGRVIRWYCTATEVGLNPRSCCSRLEKANDAALGTPL